MNKYLTSTFIITFLIAMIKTSIPILFAASGEIYSERSGVVNINLEGQILSGAFFGFLGAYLTGSLLFGVLMGALAGMLFALVFGYACITKKASQIVVGITLNITALGITSYLNRACFGITTSLPRVDVLPQVLVPGLNKIPIIGEILFNRDLMVYMSIIFAFLSYIIIFKTTFGLKMRSAGEYPRAAETMGVNVFKIQYISLMICGTLAGLGGAYLTLGMLGGFMENISGGRGFIALALVIFGKWHPLKILLAAMLFGGADALQMRLQAIGAAVPYQFMLMAPYLLTIVILIITGKRATQPAALGVPYDREKL